MATPASGASQVLGRNLLGGYAYAAAAGAGTTSPPMLPQCVVHRCPFGGVGALTFVRESIREASSTMIHAKCLEWHKGKIPWRQLAMSWLHGGKNGVSAKDRLAQTALHGAGHSMTF